MAVTDTLTLSFLVTEGEVGNTLTLSFEVLSAQSRGGGGKKDAWQTWGGLSDYREALLEAKRRKRLYEEATEQPQEVAETPKPPKVTKKIAKAREIAVADLEAKIADLERRIDDEEAALLLFAA